MEPQLSTGAAARLAGVSEQSIRQWAASGRLPSTSTPLGRLFDRHDVERLVTDRERAAREPRVRTRQVGAH